MAGRGRMGKHKAVPVTSLFGADSGLLVEESISCNCTKLEKSIVLFTLYHY